MKQHVVINISYTIHHWQSWNIWFEEWSWIIFLGLCMMWRKIVSGDSWKVVPRQGVESLSYQRTSNPQATERNWLLIVEMIRYFILLRHISMICLPNLQPWAPTLPTAETANPTPKSFFPKKSKAWVVSLSRCDGDNTHQKVPTAQAAPPWKEELWKFFDT